MVLYGFRMHTLIGWERVLKQVSHKQSIRSINTIIDTENVYSRVVFTQLKNIIGSEKTICHDILCNGI